MLNPYNSFNIPLLAWFDQHGRKDLPWQKQRSPYRVWISEMMLQQTQVITVIPYFLKFMARFPNIETLALATEDDVLSYWSGLGYYSRARYIHKTAIIIHTHFMNQFPDDLETLKKLPGIGLSTAAAIASLAFNKPTAILDGNVKRVLSRYFQVAGAPDSARVKQQLWQLANDCMAQERCADYTQAIMDLGATCCKSKKPNCQACPLNPSCLAYKNEVVHDYPHKKTKKSLPTKEQQFLVLYNKDNLIYLEKRPPTGLWGGLWCLPSIDMNVCPKSYVYDNYKIRVENSVELTKIKHSFSHFNLHITALSMKSHQSDSLVLESSGRWLSIDDIKTLGIAKPVNDIINCFLKY